MFRRAVTVPAAVETVWEAITEPGAMEDWFGALVEWELRPGGKAHFRHMAGEDADREGVVDDVEPGRRLRFRWWPADGDGDVSEVAYELEADDGGTVLTVTERRVPAVPADGADAACLRAVSDAGAGVPTSSLRVAGGVPAASLRSGSAALDGDVRFVAGDMAGPVAWSLSDQVQWETWASQRARPASGPDRRPVGAFTCAV
jgi:uncharacterized protein YndB with AHSA1/START domain